MNYLQTAIETVQSIELDSLTFLKDIGIACGIILILSVLGRMIFGKKSDINHAVSSAIGILAVYILGVFLYGTSHLLSGLLSSLPFVAVQDGKLALFSFSGAQFPEICAMLVRMVVLAFLRGVRSPASVDQPEGTEPTQVTQEQATAVRMSA